MDDYESVLLVKPEVFVYKIPPRATNRCYRAADWNLGTPDWTGRMRLVVKQDECILKLEDKTTGELFAQCPIDKYPGIAVEAVADSSRYFAIRIQDQGGRAAFIGIGFGDRSDSFDLNVALQDHFKWMKKEEDIEKDADKPGLDLRFKEGETIKINMKIKKKEGQESAKTRPRPLTGGGGLLPPPPGGVKLNPPPGSVPHHPEIQSSTVSNVDLLSGVASSHVGSEQQNKQAGGESWSDFASAPVTSASNVTPGSQSGSTSTGWVTF